MRHKRDIRPITYLKNNTADLIREVSDNGRTVLITQNGEAKAVVMDVEVYDRWKTAMAMLKMLAQSEAEFEAGKVVSQREAFSRAEAAIRRIENDGSSGNQASFDDPALAEFRRQFFPGGLLVLGQFFEDFAELF